MSFPAPQPLHENAGLAFLGEAAWTPSLLGDREAKKLLATPNDCGRPNTDVLRRRLSVADGEPREQWQIDFPPHLTAQEAALYEHPFALLQKRAGGAWLSPNPSPDLRRGLARVSRFLAMPADAATPDWRWIEDDLLPDSSLLAIVREDDFTHGVLQSPVFALWWEQHRQSPVLAVASFPFPWPPSTPLSALSKTQEEHRHAIARAARGGAAEQLDAAVSAAYGWTMDVDDDHRIERLTGLNRARSA